MDIIELIDQLNARLNQYYWFRAYKYFMALYLIMMVVAVILALYRIGRGYWIILATGQGFPKVTQGQYERQWKQIQKKMQSTNPNEWKSAVIEASYILESILSTIGYAGDSLAAKLEGMIPSQLTNLEEVKEATKIREHMLADPQFDPNKEEAERLLAIYKASLDFFHAIES